MTINRAADSRQKVKHIEINDQLYS